MGDGKASMDGTDRSFRPDGTVRPIPSIPDAILLVTTRTTRRQAVMPPRRAPGREARQQIDRHRIPLFPAGMAVRRRVGPCPRYRPPTGRQEGECR